MAFNNQMYPQFSGFNPMAPSIPYLPQYQQTAPQQPTSNVSWAYVNGIEGARAQIVQPGQTSWMMDNSDSIIYVKAVDNMGSATLKAFRLTEINDQQRKIDADADRVTRSEFDALKAKLTEIENAFGGLNT